jgi:hypothetical protein
VRLSIKCEGFPKNIYGLEGSSKFKIGSTLRTSPVYMRAMAGTAAMLLLAINGELTSFSKQCSQYWNPESNLLIRLERCKGEFRHPNRNAKHLIFYNHGILPFSITSELHSMFFPVLYSLLVWNTSKQVCIVALLQLKTYYPLIKSGSKWDLFSVILIALADISEDLKKAC